MGNRDNDLGISLHGRPLIVANKSKRRSKYLLPKPFVKWVGGKRSILVELLKRMPEDYTAYHEPFLGGGALYFSLQPKVTYLSDINFFLVLTFKAVRDDLTNLINYLKIHERLHNKEHFTKARTILAREKNPTKCAALFIYLNKTCFNGLYRVNRTGLFNVPLGNYKNPLIVDKENLERCSKVLQGTDIQPHSFEHTNIGKKEFFYLDPPYHGTYSGYHCTGFGVEEHKKLAAFCRKIDDTGGYFMMSNSDTPFVRELYKNYVIETINVARRISCKANNRGKQQELIIRNYTS